MELCLQSRLCTNALTLFDIYKIENFYLITGFFFAVQCFAPSLLLYSSVSRFELHILVWNSSDIFDETQLRNDCVSTFSSSSLTLNHSKKPGGWTSKVLTDFISIATAALAVIDPSLLLQTCLFSVRSLCVRVFHYWPRPLEAPSPHFCSEVLMYSRIQCRWD